jgi:hypothetical protein
MAPAAIPPPLKANDDEKSAIDQTFPFLTLKQQPLRIPIYQPVESTVTGIDINLQ